VRECGVERRVEGREKWRDDGEFVGGRMMGIGEDGRAEGREAKVCGEICGVERMGNGVRVGWEWSDWIADVDSG